MSVRSADAAGATNTEPPAPGSDRPDAVPEVYTASEEQLVAARLEALGYIE